MKDKTEMELNLPRDVKDSKDFCQYLGDKRQTRVNACTFPNELGELMMQDVKKVDMPNVSGIPGPRDQWESL